MTSHESLSSPPGFHLPALNDLADGIVSAEAEPTVIELTYYDTPDLRLARAGVTLLYRGDDGWVVTSAARPSPGRSSGTTSTASRRGGPAAAGGRRLVRALVRTARAARWHVCGPPSSCRAP